MGRPAVAHRRSGPVGPRRGIGQGSIRGRAAQQLGKMLLPDCGDGVCAVAARLRRHRDHDRAAVRHALDLALEDAELRRVDQVVREIDREQRRADLLQARRRDRSRAKLPADTAGRSRRRRAMSRRRRRRKLRRCCARSGICCWRSTGLLPIRNSICSAVRSPAAARGNRRSRHCGSRRIASIAIRRHTRLRPDDLRRAGWRAASEHPSRPG